jgi:hypothetical protein
MREDNGSYQGNWALTATKSWSVKIMGKSEKVAPTSGNGMGYMSSNILSQIQTL